MNGKKYGSSLTMDERVKLFAEWLNDGGIETIQFPDLLEDLLKVKFDVNGKVVPETVSSLVNAAMLAYEGDQISPPSESERYLAEYGSTLQKSRYFDQVNIDVKEQFDNLFDELKSKFLINKRY